MLNKLKLSLCSSNNFIFNIDSRVLTCFQKIRSLFKVNLFALNYTHNFDKLSIYIQILKNCVHELTQWSGLLDYGSMIYDFGMN